MSEKEAVGKLLAELLCHEAEGWSVDRIAADDTFGLLRTKRLSTRRV